MDRKLLRAQLKHTLEGTDFQNQGELYVGKVRDNYIREDDTILMITTDRISAFDKVLGTIPFKGHCLVSLADWWFGETADIIANHVKSRPHPNIWDVRKCAPIPIEMVVRGYLTGVTSTSAWSAYEKGIRNFCGVELPDGMVKNQPFDEPIITPSTKAKQGAHDESVSPEELFKRGIIDPDLYELLANYSIRLYNRGVKLASEKGMIFVDTKYEFGIYNGKIMLMDEVNTPDSSRYWMADSYHSRFEEGKEPIKLDKEFLREWLVNQGFTGKGTPPKLTDKIRIDVAEKYITLTEKFLGEPLKLDVGSTFNSIKSVVDPFDTF